MIHITQEVPYDQDRNALLSYTCYLGPFSCIFSLVKYSPNSYEEEGSRVGTEKSFLVLGFSLGGVYSYLSF